LIGFICAQTGNSIERSFAFTINSAYLNGGVNTLWFDVYKWRWLYCASCRNERHGNSNCPSPRTGVSSPPRLRSRGPSRVAMEACGVNSTHSVIRESGPSTKAPYVFGALRDMSRWAAHRAEPERRSRTRRAGWFIVALRSVERIWRPKRRMNAHECQHTLVALFVAPARALVTSIEGPALLITTIR